MPTLSARSGCEGCPYRTPLVVSPERKRGTILATIGEGPAREEEARGFALVGAAGVEHERTLARAGIARVETAIENAHACIRPYRDTNAAKLARAVSVCRHRVAGFLSEVEPLSVALLGGAALRSVCPGFVAGAGSDGLLRHRGSIWSREEVVAANAAVGEPNILPESVRFVVATIHPAAIIGRRRIEKFSAMGYRMVPAVDIRRVVECARRGRKLLPLAMGFGTPEWSGKPFAFDLETTREGRRIEWVGVQELSGEDPVVYGGPWHVMREWVEEEMASGVMKVGHNVVGFDIPVLAASGVGVREPFDDTMVLAGTCEADMARGLHFQAAYYFGEQRPFWKELVAKPEHFRRQIALRAAWRVTAREMGIQMEMATEQDWGQLYNALDVSSTRLLWQATDERARKEGWK